MRKYIISFFIAVLTIHNVHAQYSNDIKIETLLKTDTTSVGQKISYPNVEHAEVTVFRITMNPGASTGWHKHGIPLFAYILQGELTVERDGGLVNLYKTGEAVSEMQHIYHQGINKGKEPTILIAFYLGGDNRPLVTRKEN